MANADDFVYTVDAAQYRAEIDAMTRQQKDLEKSIGDAAAESIKGSRAATSALTLLIAEHGDLKGKIAGARAEYANLGKAAREAGVAAVAAAQATVVAQGETLEALLARGQIEDKEILERINNERMYQSVRSAGFINFNGLAAQSSQIVTQLAFAADDALTSFGTMGFAGAARAAGNNLSYVLAIANPMLAIVPSLATAIGTLLVPRMLGWADASKAVKTETDEAVQAMARLRDETERLGEADDARREQKTLGDFAATRGKIEQETAKAVAAEKYNRGMASALYFATAGQDYFGYQAAADRAAVDVDIGRNRVAAVRDEENRFREAAAKKALEKRAAAAIGRVDAPLKKAAEAAIAGGASPAQTQDVLSRQLAGALPAELKPFAAGHAAKIATAAAEAAEAKKLDAVGAADSTVGARRRQRTVAAARAEIEAERADAEAASPRGKLGAAERRGFEERLRPLEAENRRLQAAINLGKNRDEEAADRKRSVDHLGTIVDLLKNRNLEPAPARTPTL